MVSRKLSKEEEEEKKIFFLKLEVALAGQMFWSVENDYSLGLISEYTTC